MSTGIDTKTYFYDPFGQQVGENGMPVTDTADENPLRYCGEFLDAHSGNYYLRNRYYNPGTGRFTQEDSYWNVNNMIYGAKGYKVGEFNIPDLDAIQQSSNLYEPFGDVHFLSTFC